MRYRLGGDRISLTCFSAHARFNASDIAQDHRTLLLRREAFILPSAPKMIELTVVRSNRRLRISAAFSVTASAAPLPQGIPRE
jgi:hypothetical protein